MNVVALIGNLTRDPELRDAGGTPVASLRIAVSGRKKSGEEWVDVPNFFDVTLWGRQAELAAEHLERGRQIAVSGRLQWSEWENDAGEKRSKVEVVADNLDYLAKPKQREPSTSAEFAAEDGVISDTGAEDLPF